MKREKQKNYYKYLLVIISILFCSLVYATQITEFPTNPANNTITSNSSVNFGYNITMENGEQPTSINWTFGTSNLDIMNGLVLMYNMDNRSRLGEWANSTGCNIVDLSGQNNNGSCVGGENISFTNSGKYGGAFNFTNKTNYIRIPTFSNSLNNTSTICMWVKTTSTDKQKLLTQNRNPSNYQNVAILEILATGNFRFWDYATSANGFREVENSSKKVNDGNWNNICFTKNGLNGVYYTNGIIDGTSTALTVVTYGLSDVIIGYDYRTPTNPSFNGSIDDVIIFNRSLTASEISQLYKSSLTKYDTQNWSFQTNQSLNASLNSSNPNYSWIYGLCSSNSSSQVCSNKIITQTIPTKTITANFTTSIKTLNSYPYGVALAGSTFTWFVSGITVTDSLTSSDRFISNDYNWHRQAFANSGLNLQRLDMELEGSYTNTSDVSGVNRSDIYNTLLHGKNQILWNYQNGYKTLLVIDFMPPWLADNSSGSCSALNRCIPSNYTKYNNIVLDYINYTTNNDPLIQSSILLEFWNEPDLSFFLGSLPDGHINKSIAYNYFYNQTQTAVKLIYPNIPFGGIALSSLDTSAKKTMMNNWLANTTTQRDFISWHDYDKVYLTGASWIIGNCTAFGGNCGNIIISESSIKDDLEKNVSSNSNQYSQDIAMYLQDALNSNLNVTIINHKWSTGYPYGNPNDPDYLDLFSMVYEPNEQSTNYYPNYNTTSNFAHLCSAGSTVYQSSSDDNTIKTVSCKKGNQRSLIVINTDTSSKNVSVNLTNSGISQLSNYLDNSETFTASGNTNLGIMDSYDIKYLTEDLQSPVITIQSPLSTNYSSTLIYFNITLDEEGSYCKYTFDNWLTNFTMQKQGYVNEFKASNSNVPKGDIIVRFSCNDTSNNFATNSVNIHVTTDYEEVTEDSQTNSIDALVKTIKGFGLLITVIIFGIVIFVVYTNVTGKDMGINFEEASPLLFKILIGILIGILVVTMIVSLYS